MRVYLISAITLFSFAGILLGIGLPYTITHPACKYCNSVNPLTAYGELYAQMYIVSSSFEPLSTNGLLYGTLASIVGVLMLAIHRAEASERKQQESTPAK